MIARKSHSLNTFYQLCHRRLASSSASSSTQSERQVLIGRATHDKNISQGLAKLRDEVQEAQRTQNASANIKKSIVDTTYYRDPYEEDFLSSLKEKDFDKIKSKYQDLKASWMRQIRLQKSEELMQKSTTPTQKRQSSLILRAMEIATSITWQQLEKEHKEILLNQAPGVERLNFVLQLFKDVSFVLNIEPDASHSLFCLYALCHLQSGNGKNLEVALAWQLQFCDRLQTYKEAKYGWKILLDAAGFHDRLDLVLKTWKEFSSMKNVQDKKSLVPSLIFALKKASRKDFPLYVLDLVNYDQVKDARKSFNSSFFKQIELYQALLDTFNKEDAKHFYSELADEMGAESPSFDSRFTNVATELIAKRFGKQKFLEFLSKSCNLFKQEEADLAEIVSTIMYYSDQPISKSEEAHQLIQQVANLLNVKPGTETSISVIEFFLGVSKSSYKDEKRNKFEVNVQKIREIKASVDQKRLQEANAFYQEFLSKDFEADITSLRLLLMATAMLRQVEPVKLMPLFRACRLKWQDEVSRMSFDQDKRHEQDMSNIYHDFIRSCFKYNDYETATELHRYIQQDGVQLQHTSFTYLFGALLLRSSTFQEAMDMYRSWRDAGLRLTDGQAPFHPSLYATLINTLMKLKPIKEPFSKTIPMSFIFEVVQESYRFGANLDEVYVMVINNLGKMITASGNDSQMKRNIEMEASSFLEEKVLSMEKIDDNNDYKNKKFAPVMLTTIMSFYSRAGQKSKAIELWHKLLAKNIDFDPQTICVAIDSHAHANHLEEARNIVDWSLQGDRFVKLANQNFWDSWIECLARCKQIETAIHVAFNVAPKKLEERMQIMKERGIEDSIDKASYLREERILSRSSHDFDIESNYIGVESIRESSLRKCQPLFKTLRMLITFTSGIYDDKAMTIEVLSRAKQQFPSLFIGLQRAVSEQESFSKTRRWAKEYGLL